jgi:hypothetical protein
MSVPSAFVREVLVEMGAQANLSLSALAPSKTWDQLGIDDTTLRALADDLAFVVKEWATVPRPPVVTPDVLKSRRSIEGAVIFLAKAAFGEALAAKDADTLIQQAQSQRRGLQATQTLLSAMHTRLSAQTAKLTATRSPRRKARTRAK